VREGGLAVDFRLAVALSVSLIHLMVCLSKLRNTVATNPFDQWQERAPKIPNTTKSVNTGDRFDLIWTPAINFNTLQTNHAENKQHFCQEWNTLSKLPRWPRDSIQSRKSQRYYLPPDCCCALKGAAHGEGFVQDFSTNVHNHLLLTYKRMLWTKYNAFWFQMNLSPDYCNFPFWHWLEVLGKRLCELIGCRWWCVQSAYVVILTSCKTSGKSFVEIEKSNGPRQLSWGELLYVSDVREASIEEHSGFCWVINSPTVWWQGT
jgi:hypothetical protein